MLTATHTYHDQLAAIAEQIMPQTLDKHVAWVFFKRAQEKKNKTSGVAESRMLPKLITFDESTGCAWTAQDEESEIKAEATTPQLRLPWRAWHAHASGLGRQEAAMRCALQVLHMLHVNQVYDDMPIDIHFDETKIRSMLRPQASSRPKASCCPVCAKVQTSPGRKRAPASGGHYSDGDVARACGRAGELRTRNSSSKG